jgi:hypothetical protein
MLFVAESARKLKAFVGHTQVKQLARDMIFRMVIAFITHRVTVAWPTAIITTCRKSFATKIPVYH